MGYVEWLLGFFNQFKRTHASLLISEESFCQSMLNNTILTVLDEADIPFLGNEDIYQLALALPPEVTLEEYLSIENKLRATFVALKNADITPSEHTNILLIAMNKLEHADKLPELFSGLNACGIPFSEDPAIYRSALQNIDDNCIYLIQDMNFKVPEQLEWIKIIIEKSAHLLPMIAYLKTNKIMPNEHAFVYDAILSRSKLIASPYYQAKLRGQLDDYFKDNPLCSTAHPEYQKQCDAIQAIIDGITSAEDEITQGPLNKSEATQTMEFLLLYIARTDISEIHMHFDKSLGYTLQIGTEPKIYLSELLKLVNFTHIELTEEVVALLGEKIQHINPDYHQKAREKEFENPVLKHLPDDAKNVLAFYTGPHYTNINRVFRGLALKEPPDNLLSPFLCGCLVNWSAEELKRTLLGLEERHILETVAREIVGGHHAFKTLSPEAYQDKLGALNSQQYYQQLRTLSSEEYESAISLARDEQLITQEAYEQVKPLFNQLITLFPHYELLDRGEKLTQDNKEHLETKKQRLENPVHTAAVTSVSAFKEGAGAFQGKSMERTKFETDHDTRPVFNPAEAELVIPHGSTYLYTENPEGGFFTREVNSPGIVPWGDY